MSLFQHAPDRESTLRPNRSAFHRGRMTVIRLWGVWWSCRDFRPRPHTTHHTKRSV
jgi:hypothetical protein